MADPPADATASTATPTTPASGAGGAGAAAAAGSEDHSPDTTVFAASDDPRCLIPEFNADLSINHITNIRAVMTAKAAVLLAGPDLLDTTGSIIVLERKGGESNCCPDRFVHLLPGGVDLDELFEVDEVYDWCLKQLCDDMTRQLELDGVVTPVERDLEQDRVFGGDTTEVARLNQELYSGMVQSGALDEIRYSSGAAAKAEKK